MEVTGIQRAKLFPVHREEETAAALIPLTQSHYKELQPDYYRNNKCHYWK